jgi:hypothetical protein
MKTHLIKLIWGLVLLAAATSAKAQGYVYTVNIQQLGNDVVASGSGSWDTSAMTYEASGPIPADDMSPFFGYLSFGPLNVTTSEYATEFTVDTQGFGSSMFGYTVSSTSGEALLVHTSSSTFCIQNGYVSGTTVASSDTWSGSTFKSLGLTVGNYTWTYASGAGIYNVDVLAVPEPSNLAFSALGGLGALLTIRRRI